jgi:hypothetical protein
MTRLVRLSGRPRELLEAPLTHAHLGYVGLKTNPEGHGIGRMSIKILRWLSGTGRRASRASLVLRRRAR